MPLNPSIALGVRPLEIPNQLAQYAQVAQIEGAQRQNALAQYQLGSAQRAENVQNAMSRAYSESIDPTTGQIDYNALTRKLAAGGAGAQIPGVEKTRRDLETAALTQDKLRTELVTAKTAQFRDRLNNVNSPDAAARWTEAMYKDPHLSGTVSSVPLEAALAEIPLTPQEFNVWKKQNALGMAKFMELNKPTTQVIDQSGQRQVVQIPGLGGAPTTVGTYADVPLPANVQAQKIQIAQQSRPPLQPVAPTITTIEDPNKPGSFLQVDARTYQGGGAGSPGVIGGARPSATAEKLTLQRTQMGKDLGFAITQLGDITKDGGLIDQSTGSGAGRLTDIGAGFFGKATPGAIAIGKIAPIADLVLKMVPRFEGPQSNKDTQSYKEAAGQLADASLPTEIRKQAGKTVLRLMTERKNQFVTTDMAAEGAGPAQIAPPAGFVPDQR